MKLLSVSAWQIKIIFQR